MAEEMLLIDSCFESGFFMDLMEAATPGGPTKFRGKFQEANAVNKNKRQYPFEILDENVRRLEKTIKGRHLLGELDHPSDSIIHFATASHIVTKLWWEGNVLMGEGEILNTPNGEILRAILEQGVPVGISSRGVGNGKVNESGVLVIGESFKLITFDAVADPSTHYAFQEKIIGRKNESVEERRYVRNSEKHNNSSMKNESSGIDTISKDAWIACLDGIAKNKVNQIKTRLS